MRPARCCPALEITTQSSLPCQQSGLKTRCRATWFCTVCVYIYISFFNVSTPSISHVLSPHLTSLLQLPLCLTLIVLFVISINCLRLRSDDTKRISTPQTSLLQLSWESPSAAEVTSASSVTRCSCYVCLLSLVSMLFAFSCSLSCPVRRNTHLRSPPLEVLGVSGVARLKIKSRNTTISSSSHHTSADCSLTHRLLIQGHECYSLSWKAN